MKQTPSQPCSIWATRLAARHPSDLSPAESAALQAHLQNCPACTSAYTTYALMETAIRQLPPVAPLERLSPEHFEEASTRSHLATEPIQLLTRSRHAHSRLSRTARLANLLAAALVVAVLITGSVILFTRHASTTQVGHGSSFDLPPQAIPANFCAQANLDPGLQNLCAQHQLTKIDITKNVGGIPVTLAYAYADSNRVAILAFAPAAQLSSPLSAPPDSKQIMFGEVTTANGRSLDGTGGSGGVGQAGSKYAFFTTNADTAALPSSTHTLDLRVPISFMDLSKSNKPLATVTFAFSVPFHPARIAYPHQTITVDGQSITLDRVAIAPSEARVDIHCGPTVPGRPTILKVGNASTDGSSGGSGWRPSTSYSTDAVFEYEVSFFDQQGTGTFTITPPGPNGGKLTYVFHFVVPPQT